MPNMQDILFFLEKNLLISVISACLIFELIWIIILQINLSHFKRRKASPLEKEAESLEKMVFNHEQTIKSLDRDIRELYDISNQINGLAFRGLHRFGVVRFNPFKDVGGDQSFAIALLNGKNNGIVISSLFTKDGTRIYSKAIAGGKSEKYPLTEEEAEAIAIAKTEVNKKV
jgi:hypothetical protein